VTVDLNPITEVLKIALLRDLGDEVELIFRYGSQLKGTTHAYSDLDLSYVPGDH
jgi:predicted nucleotidyltransferase